MAYIINPQPGIGQRIAEGLGSGIQQGVDSVLQMKMREFENKQKIAQQEAERKRLIDTYIQQGHLPEDAIYLANVTPPERAVFFKEYPQGRRVRDAAIGGKKAPEQESLSLKLNQLMGMGQESQGQFDPIMQAVGQTQFKLPQQQSEMMGAEQSQRPDTQERVLGTSEKKQLAEEKKQSRKEFIDKTYPEIKKKIEAGEAAKNNKLLLQRIVDLSEKGDVNEALPVLSNFLGKHLGVDLQKFYTGDTAEIDKLSKYFLRGGPKMFGGKVSNFEAQQLLAQYPNLMQNKEGRIQVAKSASNFEERLIKSGEVAQEIMEQYPNIAPDKFESLFSKKMKPIYEKLDKELLEIHNPTKNLKVGSTLPDNFKPTKSNAAQYKGITIGQGSNKLRSNGVNWVKA